MDEWSVEAAPPGLRRSRVVAAVAFILALTSLWLPWWVVRYRDGAGVEYARDTTGPFSPLEPLTHPWMPYLTGALVVAAAAWLFVRLAGRSWLYEPPAWRRDLLVVAGLLAGAVASALVWPQDFPSFWGTRSFSLNTTGSDTFTQRAMAGLGWWCAVAGVVALGAARWLAREGLPPRQPPPRPPGPPGAP